MKLVTVLFILNCFSFLTRGQDYLITYKGDSVSGELKPMSYDVIDRVQVSRNNRKEVYTALQVKVFSFKGDVYQPVRKDNTVRFMKLLKKGYISLFAFRLENQNTFDGRYLLKQDGSYMEVPNLNFKKMLAPFVKECEEVHDKVISKDYGRSDLNQIIDEFNTCIGTRTATVKKALAVAAESNQKALPIESLKKKVEELKDFPSKKDALDLLTDMITKMKGAQTIPHYQVEALKGYLTGIDATKEDLEKVLTQLKTD